jgi:hypothetical protein
LNIWLLHMWQENDYWGSGCVTLYEILLISMIDWTQSRI